MSRAGVWLTLCAAAALGGLALDQLHVRTGTLEYAHPVLAGQPWWIVPEFGVAGLLLGLGLVGISQVVLPARISQSTLALDALWFVGVYAVSGLAGSHALLFGSAGFVAWAVRVAVRSDRALVLALSAALGIGGPVFEAALSSTGTFEYVHPDVGGVPLWLPVLYLHGALLAADVMPMLAESG